MAAHPSTSPSQVMCLLTYTPRADSASRGYDDWLRSIDNPFFNGIPGIVRIAVQRQPETRLHCVRSDGTVMLMVMDKTEEVRAWHTITCDGLIEDVCVLPALDGEEDDQVYYIVQRTCHARLFSDALASFTFWGWQAIILLAAVTLPLGITSGKEYAELEWPIDILIAVVWLSFTFNFIMTIANRKSSHIYVSNWFFLGIFLGNLVRFLFWFTDRFVWLHGLLVHCRVYIGFRYCGIIYNIGLFSSITTSTSVCVS